MPILRAELEGLVDAGATFIQIDEPSPAIHPDAPADFSGAVQRGRRSRSSAVPGSAPISASGTTSGRPLARRTYRPVLDAMLGFHVDELVLEFANREMAEVEILGEIAAAGRDVAAGVIDVKNYYLETADDVAERIDAVLAAGVPAERLTPRPRLRLQPDRPLGDHAPSSVRWSPAATSSLGRARHLEHLGGGPWTATRSRCSAPA